MDDVKINWVSIETARPLAPNADIGLLLGRIAMRDRHALRDLYHLTGGKILALLQDVFKDEGEANDVLVDVFVRIWADAHCFQTCMAQPAGWLFAVMRSCVRERSATTALSCRAGRDLQVQVPDGPMAFARLLDVARQAMPDAPSLCDDRPGLC